MLLLRERKKNEWCLLVSVAFLLREPPDREPSSLPPTLRGLLHSSLLFGLNAAVNNSLATK